MDFKEYYKKQLAKSPNLRKVKYDLQWDMAFHTATKAFTLRLNAGMTQNKLAKKTGLRQPSIARAEAYGCSIGTLAKIAKAVGKKIVIKIEDKDLLSDTN